MSFWKELSRRNVVKVGIAYAVAAWLIIHPVDIIFPILHLPEWSITLVAAILIILFPLVLIFSWIYEVTPKGLKRTKEVPVSKSITHLTGKRLNYIIIGLLVVAVAYLLFDKYYLNRNITEIKHVPVVSTETKTKKSIAVVPFVNLSSDKEQESFVDGLSEELINTIAQFPDLRVIARTSSFTFKGADKTAQEIAKALDVEYILEGSTRKDGNDLRITAQLIKAADESHLWAKNYDKKLKNIFAVQEDIAKAVANELKIALGLGKSLQPLGGTDNVDAYELYLDAIGHIDGTVPASKSALESLDNAIALDPEFALAWVAKAFVHELLSMTLPPDQAASEPAAGLKAAWKAIYLEPDLPNAYAMLGNIKSSGGDWIEAETAYSKAIELAPEPSPMISSYSQYLFAVGYFEKAKKFNQAALRNDPINFSVRSLYSMSFALLGDKQQAEKEIEHAKALRGDRMSPEFITQVRLAFGDAVSKKEISASLGPYGNVEIDMQSSEKGIAELHAFLADNKDLPVVNLNIVALIAANLGDHELAMDIIKKLSTANPKSIFFAWLPVFREVRQLPRFKALVREIGLVDYWNKFGWPDMCHQLDNGDFVCD